MLRSSHKLYTAFHLRHAASSLIRRIERSHPPHALACEPKRPLIRALSYAL